MLLRTLWAQACGAGLQVPGPSWLMALGEPATGPHCVKSRPPDMWGSVAGALTLCAVIPEAATGGGTCGMCRGGAFRDLRGVGCAGKSPGQAACMLLAQAPTGLLGAAGVSLTRQVMWRSPCPHPDRESHPRF